MIFFRKRPPPRTPAPVSASDSMHPWDPRMRLLALGDADDWLTLGNCYTGIAATGSTGSGKSSVLAILAVLLMRIGAGFVWHCAKPSEVGLVRRLARYAGREDDVIVIGEDVDGTITQHRYNPLDYEASVPGVGTGAVVRYLSDCHKVLSHKEGSQSQGGDGDRFWTENFERLLRYTIDTAKLAGRNLSVQLLRDIQISAPLNPGQLGDDAWCEKSLCWQCLLEAEMRVERSEIDVADFDRVLNFWVKDWAQLDAKPRGTIDVMFASLLDSFYAEEPLRTILTTTTTVTPDDVIEKGKIVVLSLPTSIYLEAGRMAQFTFRYSYQRAMLRRKRKENETFLRPSVIFCDEAHRFAHHFDSTYFAEVRSNCGVSIFLEQGIGGYMDALGVTSKDQVDRYLQNLATKLFFASDSSLTNSFAADVIGKRMLIKESDTWGQSRDHTQGGGSTTTEERYQILPGQFAELKRGGYQNDRIVECYITQAGTIFNATGTNFMLCQFEQTELTQ